MTYEAKLIRKPSGELIPILGKYFFQPCTSDPSVGINFTRSGNEWIVQNKNQLIFNKYAWASERTEIFLNKKLLIGKKIIYNKDKLEIKNEIYQFTREFCTNKTANNKSKLKSNKSFDKENAEATTMTKSKDFEQLPVLNIAEELYCSICSEIFFGPVTLSCGHTFCIDCFNAWKAVKKFCPMCRAPFDGDPTNSIILNNVIAKVLAELPTAFRTERAQLNLTRGLGKLKN